MLACVSTLSAIDLNLPPDANALASANMTILNENPASVFSLPSEGTTGYETSVSYLYSETTLPLYSLFLGHNLLGGIAEAGAQVLSHLLYQENDILLNYHRRWNVLSIGVNERLLSASVKNGSHSCAYITDAGFGLDVTSFQTAIAIHNLFKSKYQNEVLPVLYIAEMAYKPVDTATIGLGCEKQQGYDASLRIATKYQVTSAFQLIAGYQYQPDRFSAGVEFACKRWQLCYALQTHPDLDLTHAISLTWK
jgi:hypothetical protein